MAGGRRKAGEAEEDGGNELAAMFGDKSARLVSGIAVVKQRQDGTGEGASAGRLVLSLADGSRVFGCADCQFTSDGRREMTLHRHEEHGGVLRGPDREGSDDDDPIPELPEHLEDMTLGYLLELAREVRDWSATIESYRQQVEHWQTEARAAQAELRRVQRALARLGFQKIVDEESR